MIAYLIYKDYGYNDKKPWKVARADGQLDEACCRMRTLQGAVNVCNTAGGEGTFEVIRETTPHA